MGLKRHVTPVLPSSSKPVAPPEIETEPVLPGVDFRNVALGIIALMAAIFVLQYSQPVLIPIVLGILISYALAPIVSGLERIRIPRAVGAAVAVILVVITLGTGVYTLSDQVMQIVSNVPEAAQRIRERVRSHRRAPGGTLQQVQRAATEIDKAAAEASQTSNTQSAATRPDVSKVEIVQPAFKATNYLWSGGMGLVGFLSQFVLILFLVYFLLVTGDLYKRKLVKIAGPTLSHKKITIQILDDINRQIENFMRVQVVTSSIVTVATGAALWWFGVEQFVVWGLLAGILNSIPYLGPVLVTSALGIVTFVQFDDPVKTAYVCGVTFAITTLEGFLLTPALMGRASQMNPVAIFVGLIVWSWLWGIWGTMLAVPMLMMIKAVCDHIEDLRPVGELMGE